ncbi:MAG: hypothetical protein JJ891_01240 [Rhizobiaceae bacterium]|jgi:hypothetical protein|nr:hypothetical protein [Rhizobiaceae bacterium]
MFVGANGGEFASKLLKYLQEVDYRLAATREEREAIYRLRYRAYRREDGIDENPDGRFHDAYDDFDNCWLFGIYLDDELASSIRFHVISPETPRGPALDVFPDAIWPMLEAGQTVIDPTRFVTCERAAKRYPELPYMTLRAACMGYEYFNADFVLATVRREHQAFYRRVLEAEVVCEPRPYPKLKRPISLLKANVSKTREKIARRYPIFESSYTERRLIFSQPNHVPMGFPQAPLQALAS